MKVLVGTDIVEIKRIKEIIEENKSFVDRVYSDDEKEYCFEKNIQMYQSFAGRFAAKEAVYKALSAFIKDYEWKKIEVQKDITGRPYLRLNINIEGIKIISSDISISHSNNDAVATVIFLVEEVS